MSTTLERPRPVVVPSAEPSRPDRAPRRSPGVGLGRAGLYVAVAATVLVMSVPLVWMVLASFKTPEELSTVPLQWLPGSFDFANYHQAATTIPIGRMFFNSVLLTVLGTGLKVMLGLCCAYALVFLDIPFKKFWFALVLFALLIPTQITIIPNYTLVASLGWLNTYQGILVPGLASAFGTFLFRQHFLTLPKAVLEAAEMDGAGHWRRLWRFVLPMSVPTVVAVSLVSIVGEWNEYLWPRLVTDNTDTMPLPVGLTLLQDIDGMNNWGVLMAATVIVTLPIVIFFLVLQRRLVAGFTAGATTG